MQNPVYVYNGSLPTGPATSVAAPVPIYLTARPWQAAYMNPALPPCTASAFNFNPLISTSKNDDNGNSTPTAVQHPVAAAVQAGYRPANPVPIRFYDPNMTPLTAQSSGINKLRSSEKGISLFSHTCLYSHMFKIMLQHFTSFFYFISFIRRLISYSKLKLLSRTQHRQSYAFL